MTSFGRRDATHRPADPSPDDIEAQTARAASARPTEPLEGEFATP